MKVKKYECTQCGGNINPATMTCEYCGSKFKRDADDRPIFISKFDPKMDVLKAQVIIPNETVYYMGAKEASQVAMHELVDKITESISQYLDILVETDLMHNTRILSGKLRIIRPDTRFYNDPNMIVEDHFSERR